MADEVSDSAPAPDGARHPGSAGRQPRPQLGVFGKNLVVLFASVLLVLAVLELAARRLAPQYVGLHVHPARIWKDDFMAHDRLGMYHETLGWKLKPNATTISKTWECCHEISTNSRGFRCDEIPFERCPGVRRILLLGDSFGMGDGVPRGDLFADLLSRDLPEIEVVNLSVNGYGTDQELLLYRIEGIHYGSDVVILALTVSNDIFNNGVRSVYGMNKPYYVWNGHELLLQGVPVPYSMLQSTKVPAHLPPAHPVHDWLDSHSGLYALVFHRLASIESLRRQWEKSGLLYQQEAIFYPQQIEILETAPKPQAEQAWLITEKLLIRLHNNALKHGSILAIVLIPSQVQVYPELWERAVIEYRLDKRKYDPVCPNRRLVGFCKSNGIHVLDLLPKFREEQPTSLPLYYRRNPHWTPEGHRVAARAIAAFLQDEVLPSL